MDNKIAELRTRLYVSCVVILALGLLGAALIYVTAKDGPEDAASYVVIDGTAYPVAPGSSKTYVRQLQRYGGKAAVILDEFNRWFEGLWHGKSLAITVAWISVLVSFGIFLFARYLLPRKNDELI